MSLYYIKLISENLCVLREYVCVVMWYVCIWEGTIYHSTRSIKEYKICTHLNREIQGKGENAVAPDWQLHSKAILHCLPRAPKAYLYTTLLQLWQIYYWVKRRDPEVIVDPLEKVSKRWAEIHPEDVRREGKPEDTKINLEEGGTHWESSTETYILPYVHLDSRKKFTV